MTIEIDPSDVQLFAPNITDEQAAALISGTIARAGFYAPGILAAEFTGTAAAQDIIRAAVLRSWRAAGGNVTTSTIGPYSTTVDSRVRVDGLFEASELDELRQMCLEPNTVGVALPLFNAPACAPRWPDPVEVRYYRGYRV